MKCLHQLIEDQARRTPHSPALAFEGRRLSYAELERRAGALAGELALEVEPAHPRHADVEHQAGDAILAFGRQELLGGGEALHLEPGDANQPLRRLPEVRVVVDRRE